MIQIRRRTAAVAVLALVVATASLVVTLTRTAGAGGNTFNDTPPWIEDHANWLAANNIATGFSDGSFKPNNNITRGQAAFWFGNYNDAITKHEQPFTEPSSLNSLSEFVACPAGKRPMGGGGKVSDPLMFVTNTRPVDETEPPYFATGWLVEWNSVAGGVGSQPGTVYVICAPGTVTVP